MQFRGKLDEADLSDLRKLTRSKTYWVRLIVANWYGTVLILMAIWATISALLGYIRPNWQALAIAWGVGGGLFVWSIYWTKRTQAKQLTQLNARLPDEVSLTNAGVKLDGPNGATGFLPWRNFKGWREGRRVMLIDQCQRDAAVMLPVAQLSEIERIPIRQFLESHIPPAGV